MNEEFIPYEQALSLKELGFDEPCFGWYRSSLIPSNFTEYFLETEFGMNESPSDCVNSNFLDKACSSPLYQQAFRWFREKHNLTANPSICSNGTWSAWVMSIPYNPEDGIMNDTDGFKTYDEAQLACLNKLIELIKKK